jgi:succinate-acetate transporter protein
LTTTAPVADDAVATRVTLRPVASSLPLGFLALALATVSFAAVQLGWVAPTEGRVAAIGAMAATVPLQLLASVLGFLARDVVAATGMGVLAGTWGTIGLTTLTSPPGAVSPGLGVFLLTAGGCMLVPAAAATAKLVPATVMTLAGVRFAVTGAHQLTGGAGWKAAAGWVGLLLGVVAAYAAVALALESTQGRTVLPLGRRQPSVSAVRGEAPLESRDLAGEPGVRPQL